MNLREYIFYHKKTVTEMAKEIDITRSYLSRLLGGNKAISKKVARNIEKATNGLVTAETINAESKHPNIR